MTGETWGEYRACELRRLAGELAAIEVAVNAYWLTRWAYRLVRLLHWRPWR